MGRVDLKLDWCDAKAARYAVMRWHYSKRMPAGKVARVGVWEDGTFVGAVIFGGGATPEIGKPFGLGRQQVCELVRVAMSKHTTFVSRILSIACRMLQMQSPGIELVVSFADSEQGHHGGIYQAAGWTYIGDSITHVIRIGGVERHPKTLHALYGVGGQSIPWLRANIDPAAKRVLKPPKHKYVMPFTDHARRIVEPMRKPYPKRARSDTSDTAPDQGAKGGAAPTLALSEVDA